MDGNSLLQDEIQPGFGSWEMLPDLRYDEVFAPFGCHVEQVTGGEELRPALRRACRSGKVAVVNVIADTDGPEASLPWLRLKAGEFHSRGIGDLPESIRRHFRGLPVIEALRLHKTALDNGTRMPLSFLAALTGNSEEDLHRAVEATGYRY
ncbi:hypothetical protein [Amycolatopsis jejuensis]|uniref:hypothetical protein n=1 Tax=Amycolatopsis jejuensis TaxID=330084 RepID=UPI000527E68F|nr:hypothetical protein [Amycolatopsis jejuensis]